MPVATDVIPDANVRKVLLNVGFIQSLIFKLADSEECITEKFPNVFPARSNSRHFYLLMNKDEKVEQAKSFNGKVFSHQNLLNSGYVYTQPHKFIKIMYK